MSDKIKSQDLYKVWSAPDNSRLMPNQISIRLPVHVAAKLYALEEIFPNRTRTEMIADLLNTAIDDLVDGLPYEGVGEPAGYDPEHGEYYHYYTGLGEDYRCAHSRKKEEIESELSKPVKKKTRRKS